MLSEVFYSFFITTVVGLLLAIARMLYKSKCTEFSFCCLKINRDVNLEANIDAVTIENGQNSSEKIQDTRLPIEGLNGKANHQLSSMPVRKEIKYEPEEVKDSGV